MPHRPSVSIKMDVSSGSHSNIYKQAMVANLVKTQQAQQSKAPSALNGSMVARVHNVRPGCGSCGRG
jgi:hypothetical protein